ncbi:MAG: pyrroline-5-carboxylate reductase [Negativicutes bacterium]|nr:pyrroline-5-carboxylate reductase [Negativicutes bacterium]
MLDNKQIGFVGGGAIAEALIAGLLKASRVLPAQIIVSDINSARLKYLESTFGVMTSHDSQEVATKADLLFLTVKPQVMNEVLDVVAPVVSKATVVVSVAAGITIGTLQGKMPGVPIVRVMPNTPVAVSEGMSAIALGKYAGKKIEDMVTYIFSSVGKVVTVDEGAMDAVTGLSGSGPAYAFLLIDALSDAGVRVGFSRRTSVLLAAQTLLGAAKMVLETGEHPAKLRDMVTSPGGTAITGIHMLEQRGVRAAMIDAVVAATKRSGEMGKK